MNGNAELKRFLLDRIGSGPAERIDRLVAVFNLPRTELRPGTLLTRRLDNRQIVVKVLEEGFEFETRRYGSLSAIAREVTGTRWNGLLFFGLAERRHA